MVDNTTNNNIESDKKCFRGFLSINDIKDKEYNSIELNHNERLALKNYDRYRIEELNKQVNDKDFQKRYFQLQAMANLTPFEEFLKEIYF